MATHGNYNSCRVETIYITARLSFIWKEQSQKFILSRLLLGSQNIDKWPLRYASPCRRASVLVKSSCIHETKILSGHTESKNSGGLFIHQLGASSRKVFIGVLLRTPLLCVPFCKFSWRAILYVYIFLIIVGQVDYTCPILVTYFVLIKNWTTLLVVSKVKDIRRLVYSVSLSIHWHF